MSQNVTQRNTSSVVAMRSGSLREGVIVNRQPIEREITMSKPTRSGKAVVATMLISFCAAVAGSAMAADTQWEKNHPRRDQVNDRLENQNKRINKELKEGDLTKAQARKLHRKDRQIRQEERAMASQNGGHITKAEQKVLNRQENAVSKQIGK